MFSEKLVLNVTELKKWADKQGWLLFYTTEYSPSSERDRGIKREIEELMERQEIEAQTPQYDAYRFITPTGIVVAVDVEPATGVVDNFLPYIEAGIWDNRKKFGKLEGV